jgi:hypothetical protein
MRSLPPNKFAVLVLVLWVRLGKRKITKTWMRDIFLQGHILRTVGRCSNIVELYVAFCLWIRMRRGLTLYVSSNCLSGWTRGAVGDSMIDYWSANSYAS